MTGHENERPKLIRPRLWFFPLSGVAAVLLSLWLTAEDVGFGLGSVLFCVPVFARAIWQCHREVCDGSEPDWAECFSMLVTSAGVVVLIGISSTIAFVTVCFPAGMIGPGALPIAPLRSGSAEKMMNQFLWYSVLPGVIFGLIVAVLVARKIWWKGIATKKK